MFRTDDPIADHIAYEARRERALKRLPICCECRYPIQTNECYAFGDDLICPECLNENHLQATEEYID